MKEFLPTYVPRISVNFYHEKKEEFHILLHRKNPLWAVVNDRGFEIIKHCNGTNSLKDIERIIASKYRISSENICNDIIHYLNKLKRSFSAKGEELYEQATDIKSLFLHITNGCNLKCKHCYSFDNKKTTGNLKKKEIIKLIDEFRELGGKKLTISGGEPLLRKDILSILKYASHSLEVMLLTNGTLINEKIANFLSENRISVQVSLDGSEAMVNDKIRGNGSFNATMKGISLLKQYGLKDKLIICTTITNHNIEDIPKLIKLVKELEIPVLRFLPLHRVGSALRNWNKVNGDISADDYIRLYRFLFSQRNENIKITSGLNGLVLRMRNNRTWCPIGRTAAITSNGDIYPCALLMEDKFYLGNIRKDSLSEVRNSTRFKSIIEISLSRREKIEKCKNCSWKNLCQAGCPGISLMSKGTIWATDDFCDLRRELYKEIIFNISAKKYGEKALPAWQEC